METFWTLECANCAICDAVVLCVQLYVCVYLCIRACICTCVHQSPPTVPLNYTGKRR